MSQPQFVKFRKNTQNELLAPYRAHLLSRRGQLAAKRAFDIFAALLCIVIILPFFLLAVIAIKLTSAGPVFYRQLRVGKDGSELSVLKLRTMVVGADKKGEITVGSNDSRITRVGHILRITRLDEFPQMFQVFTGSMSIVGVRPEVPHYVDYYTPEDYATLLMKPGLVSDASIKYRHENDLLAGSSDPERDYIERILPDKMVINRDYIRNFSFSGDMGIVGASLKCVFQKDEALKKSE